IIKRELGLATMPYDSRNRASASSYLPLSNAVLPALYAPLASSFCLGVAASIDAPATVEVGDATAGLLGSGGLSSGFAGRAGGFASGFAGAALAGGAAGFAGGAAGFASGFAGAALAGGAAGFGGGFWA